MRDLQRNYFNLKKKITRVVSRVASGNVGVGYKVGQISPKWANPGLFQIRFQYILAQGAKMY